MSILVRIDPKHTAAGYLFFCPGCRCGHLVTVNGCRNGVGATWGWNGSLELPTFTPSVLVNAGDAAARCHSYVQNGQIHFLNDCFHELKGKTVDLPDFDKE